VDKPKKFFYRRFRRGLSVFVPLGDESKKLMDRIERLAEEARGGRILQATMGFKDCKRSVSVTEDAPGVESTSASLGEKTIPFLR
jgi:hypothetical protein